MRFLYQTNDFYLFKCHIYMACLIIIHFLSIACVFETKLNRVQMVQNMAIRCINRLKWDSPSGSLFIIVTYSQNYTLQ